MAAEAARQWSGPDHTQFLSVSFRDCSRGKSSSSGGFITSLAVVSSEAGGEGTANASPV